MTLNEVCDKLDRTTDHYNVIKNENEKLKNDIKTAQADNALLFKKVVSLQDQLVTIYNKKNEEVKVIEKDDNVEEVGEEAIRSQSVITKHKRLNEEDEDGEEVVSSPFSKTSKDEQFYSLSSTLPNRAVHK